MFPPVPLWFLSFFGSIFFMSRNVLILCSQTLFSPDLVIWCILKVLPFSEINNDIYVRFFQLFLCFHFHIYFYFIICTDIWGVKLNRLLIPFKT